MNDLIAWWHSLDEQWQSILSINHFYFFELPEKEREPVLAVGVNPFDNYEFRFGKAFTKSITNEKHINELQQLTFIYAASTDISSLDPLKALPALELIDSCFNHISDLHPIAGLRAVKKLLLDSNDIDDCSAFATLDLDELVVRRNGLTSMDGIAALNNLKFLDIGQNRIRSVEAVTGLRQLEEFYCDANDLTDVSFIACLKNLSMLNIANNAITNIAFLTDLPMLEFVDLSGNNLAPSHPVIAELSRRGVEVVLS